MLFLGRKQTEISTLKCSGLCLPLKRSTSSAASQAHRGGERLAPAKSLGAGRVHIGRRGRISAQAFTLRDPPESTKRPRGLGTSSFSFNNSSGQITGPWETWVSSTPRAYRLWTGHHPLCPHPLSEHSWSGLTAGSFPLMIRGAEAAPRGL